jgi:nitrous oxide reductase accessory protein NosL
MMNIAILKNLFLAFFIFAIFSGCQDNTLEEGMKKVHWDRDICERCKMIISERKFAVQILNPKTNQSYMFDDLGCAVLWFKEEKLDWFNEAKIWINDASSGQWLNAKEAIYVSNTLTPMGYGLSAYSKKTIVENSNSLTFEQAVEKIIQIDEAQKNRRKDK